MIAAVFPGSGFLGLAPVFLGLAHAALLWSGLGLASVPVIIHLLFRRRHRVVRWAAMEFLLAALKKQKRRVQMENLILLLLRCAMIVLLGLALARPAVTSAMLSPLGGSARGVILVLDTSTSTAARTTGRRTIDRIRERARSFLQELPDGSEVTLIVTRDDLQGGAPAALLEGAEPARARDRIERQVQAGHGPNDLAEVMRFARGKLESVGGRKGIVLITDLQQRDWADADGRRIEDLHRALRALADPGGQNGPGGQDGRGERDPVPVTVLAAGIVEPENIAVTALTIERGRAAFAGTTVGLSATLVNYSSSEATGTLTLYTASASSGADSRSSDRVDAGRDSSVSGSGSGSGSVSGSGDWGWEKRDPVHTVTIPPSLAVGEIRPHFVDLFVPLATDMAGPTRFKVVFRADRGPSDRLALDNERYLALDVRPPVRVLPVRSFRNATELIRDVSVVRIIDFLSPILPEQLAATDLARVDVVVWADADFHDLDEEGAGMLREFVAAGGGLIAYLGEYARPASRVNGFFHRENGEGLFPMLLRDGEPQRVTEGGNPFRIDLAAADRDGKGHPVFRETGDSTWCWSPAYVSFRPVDEYKPESVLAHFDTEQRDPAVLEHRHGVGRVIVVTSTPDERGFALDGSLLPPVLFFNAVHYLVAAEPQRFNVLAGRSVTIPLARGARRVSIEPPSGAGGIIEEPVKENAREFRLSDTLHPGFYAVTVRTLPSGAGAIESDRLFLAASNLDPAEFDLRSIRTNEIDRLYPRNSLRFVSGVEQLLPEGGASEEGELSRALLAGVVILLFSELFLAWRFGNRRRRAA